MSAIGRTPLMRPDDSETILCGQLRTVADAQTALIESFLRSCLWPPTQLAETLEDIGNDLLRYADTIARQRREDEGTMACDA